MSDERKKQRDPWGLIVSIGCAVPAILGVLVVLYLFVSVVFLGGSSACPQNLC